MLYFIIIELKNSTEGLNRRLDQAEEKTSKLKDRIVEFLNQKRKKKIAVNNGQIIQAEKSIRKHWT